MWRSLLLNGSGLLRVISVLLTMAILSTIEQARPADQPREEHATAAMYASSLLLGMQLGAKQGATSLADCLRALNSSSLTDIVQSVLVENLTRTELKTADLFFASAAGKKYVKLSELDVYASAGQAPPEDAPTISEAESKEIDRFNDSAVEHKLSWVLNSDSARSLYAPRLTVLMKSCGAGRR